MDLCACVTTTRKTKPKREWELQKGTKKGIYKCICGEATRAGRWVGYTDKRDRDGMGCA